MSTIIYINITSGGSVHRLKQNVVQKFFADSPGKRQNLFIFITRL